jgi:tricorn protease
MTAQPGYFRHPTINGENLAFVCEDDLWSAGLDGGIARRLTANPGIVSFPAFSPNGKSIALTGRDDGPTEVYRIDADGGPLRRLTWLGASTQVVGWHPSGKSILFASDWRKAFMKDVDLLSVPADGGPPKALSLGPARAISYQPGGAGIVLGRNSGDPARWKRYRGGTAGTIWIDRTGQGAYVQLLKVNGNLATPMWIGSRIYFLSDHEGYGNLYSCTPTGRDLKRHTHHEDYFVRYPSTDGRRIVYHAGADIFVYDPQAGVEKKIDIRLHSPRTQLNRKYVSATRYLEDFNLHPQGHSVATSHRGGLYTMGLWEGAPLRLGDPNGVRYRLGSWLPDGRRLVAVSDEGGEENLVVFSVVSEHENPAPPQKGARGARTRRATSKEEVGTAFETSRAIPGDFGRPLHLLVAPAGADRVALCNHRQEVIVVELTTGKSKLLERSLFGRMKGLAWSPDGRWLVYGYRDSARTSRLHLWDSESGRITPITKTGFLDLQPAFDPDGRYLYCISYRVFDPVYDRLYFDLGFPKGSKPCLITLRRDAVSPFAAATRTPRAPGAPAGEADPAGKTEPGSGKPEQDKPPKVEIDLDGIEDRMVAFPVPEGIYDKILAAKNRVLLMSSPVEGSLDMNWFSDGEPPAKATLQAYLFEEDKTETVADKVTDFAVSLDGKVMGIRSGNRIRVVPVTHKTDGKPSKDEPGRESGWVDLERQRVSVVPAEEWRQMFREAWRLQRDHFWSSDMSGHDWKEVHDRYRPLVDRVASRAEFSDLLWEMQGELGTSHCYELGGDYRPEPAWHQGFLGVDIEFNVKSGTWCIARLPHGDSWDDKRACPLAAPGLNLAPGDEILAVGGLPVNRNVSPYERLVNHAGREVQLTIRSRGSSGQNARRQPAPSRGGRRARPLEGEATAGQERTITVRTLREEYSLRYRDWVEVNRAWVHQHSDGRVGYVHIPNMGPLGYSEFHRSFLSEVNHQGLIIDVRFNGGGHVSQLLLEKLLRKRVGYDANRWGTPDSYPSDAPMGPMVALTNEYAGSDGDIFSHCFKLFGLGPLIGKRTWGGVVGIWPRHFLVDGTMTTQPEFAFWFKDVGWGVENYGTDPDIEVEIRPQDHAAGKDPQMERGLAEVEKLIRRLRPKLPVFKDRPRIRPGRLPKV